MELKESEALGSSPENNRVAPFMMKVLMRQYFGMSMILPGDLH